MKPESGDIASNANFPSLLCYIQTRVEVTKQAPFILFFLLNNDMFKNVMKSFLKDPA